MAQTIIAALQDFFYNCPLMDGKKINVDYLPESHKRSGIQYSIDTTPATEIIKRHINGATTRQYLFVLRSVNPYSSDTLQAIANCGFYEALSDWLDAQTNAGTLPVLPRGKTAQTIEAQTTGYLFTTSADSGKYQIQCRLTYHQED